MAAQHPGSDKVPAEDPAADEAGHTDHPGDPAEIDERPQRRREWSDPVRSVVLPLLAVAVIVGVVWYLQVGRTSGGFTTPSGTGIIARDPTRNHTGKPAAAAVGRVAPDFRLATLDGKALRLSDTQGKIVLINFWATWCPPCRQETPEIVRAYNQYKDKGFTVVSVDEQEDPGTVQKWVDEFGIPFLVALDTSGQVGQAFRAGTQFPTSVWLDPQGVITQVKYGPMDRQFFERKLSSLQQ